jgi:chemotaxis signal transduction protein
MTEELSPLLTRLEVLEREIQNLRHQLSETLLARDVPTGVLPLLVCRTESGRFSVLLDRVERVLPLARLASLPEAAPWVAGTLNLRGESLTVIDVQRRLTGRRHDWAVSDRIVVCRSQWHRAGLLVQEVCDIRSVEAKNTRHPAPGTFFAPYLVALLHDEQESLPVVDVDQLLALSSLPSAA